MSGAEERWREGEETGVGMWRNGERRAKKREVVEIESELVREKGMRGVERDIGEMERGE